MNHNRHGNDPQCGHRKYPYIGSPYYSVTGTTVAGWPRCSSITILVRKKDD